LWIRLEKILRAPTPDTTSVIAQLSGRMQSCSMRKFHEHGLCTKQNPMSEAKMRTLKVTTWNIEHFQKALEETDTARLDAIRQEIREVDPDVLCLVEAPWSPSLLMRWLKDASSGLGEEWVLPLIDGTDTFLDPAGQDNHSGLKQLYAMQGNTTTGGQWIWFLAPRTCQ
jgi:hypothetical protein